MGLFGNKKEGGLMDVIRCDEKDYLVWKWSPDGVPSRKENAIRYGSSLRVKDGEVAVFVYRQSNGQMQDFIEGPFDQTIKTANFPVLTSIVGAAFGGASPFQAEIYFINLASNVQIPFFIKELNITEPDTPRFPVPITVKGSVTFGIKDYKKFIKNYRMRDLDMEEFREKIKEAVIECVKEFVLNAPYQMNIPVIQIERCIAAISNAVAPRLKEVLAGDSVCVYLERFNLSAITIIEDSENYRKYYANTAELQAQARQAQNRVGIKNLEDQQVISTENMAEALRIQREETQRAQRLQTEMANISAHQLNIQGDVAKTAAQSLGELGGSGIGMGGDGGMNPAGMMTGMMMGGAVGGTMSNMMGNMMQGMNQPQPPAPPASAIAQYHVANNGQQAGPYTMEQLRQMVTTGGLTRETYVWKQGMGAWEMAANVPEVAGLFGCVPPPPPPAKPPAL